MNYNHDDPDGANSDSANARDDPSPDGTRYDSDASAVGSAASGELEEDAPIETYEHQDPSQFQSEPAEAASCYSLPSAQHAEYLASPPSNKPANINTTLPIGGAHTYQSSLTIQQQASKKDVQESNTKTSKMPEVDDSTDAPIPFSQSIQEDMMEVKKRRLLKERVSEDAGTRDINETLAPNQRRGSASSRTSSGTDLISDIFAAASQGLNYPILQATLADEAFEEDRQGPIYIRIEPSGPVYDAVMVPNENEESRNIGVTEPHWDEKRSVLGNMLAALVLGLVVMAVAIASSGKRKADFTPSPEVNTTKPNSSNETYTVRGSTWVDSNYDGVYQLSEPPLAMITVNLRYCDDALVVEEAISDEKGNYKFEGVEGGRYYVDFMLPSHQYKYSNDLPSGKSRCKVVYSPQTIDMGYLDRGDIKQELETNALSRGIKFDNLSSSDSRNLAFDWLLNEDPLTLDVFDSSLIRRYILALLAFEFGGLQSFDWLSGEDECFWYGIECVEGEVIGLGLGGLNLHGTIPPEIVKIFNNTYSGTLPSELGNANEQYLSLHDNRFNGTLPAELGQLKQLASLHVHQNSLSGTLPTSLGDLKILEWLYLSGNNFTGTLPSELCQLDQLFELDVNENSLSGTLPTSLGDLKNLEWLDLSENNFTGTLPWELGQLKQLFELDVNENSLSGTLPASLGDLPNLYQLDISGNNFSGTLPSELGQLEQLLQLLVAENNLSGTLPTSLGDLKNLEWLWISWNNFTGTLPSELGQLEHLLQVEIRENSLSGTLPTSLGDLPNLFWLDLSGNAFSGTLSSELGQLEQLVYFIVEENSLSGTLPTSLGDLQNLYWLDLGRNNFTGTLPSELEKLKHMEELGLHGNKLHGTVPSELKSMTQLSQLWLNNNGFTGPLPSWIGDFQYLTSLDIQNNKFSGVFPIEIMSELNLTRFCLDGNNFEGNIPSEIEIFDNCTLDEN